MWQNCDFWLNCSFQLLSYVGGFNLNSENLDSSSSWMWPWRQSWTKSYLVNGVVIFCSVLHWLYKTVPQPPPLRHLSRSEHAAGRREALLWNLIPTFTEHGRYSTSALSMLHEFLWCGSVLFYLLCVWCPAGLQRAALAAFGQEIAHLQSRGQISHPAWSPLRWTRHKQSGS